MSEASVEHIAATEHSIERRRSAEKVKFFSNCAAWAVWAYFRRGGFLILKKSEWGWWPHFMWSPDMHTCQQFEPDHKRRRGRLWPPFFYRGYVKKTLL